VCGVTAEKTRTSRGVPVGNHGRKTDAHSTLGRKIYVIIPLEAQNCIIILLQYKRFVSS